MATSLTFEEHVAALRADGGRLAELAVTAGSEAPVPTCPDWNVQALLAHQAMIHRWATAVVREDDPISVVPAVDLLTLADLPAYYLEGHAGLITALYEAPDDLEVMTFLPDSPRPREFWARRQAHETTVHMVDALAAALGRLPSDDETEIDSAFAADGIDELLRGFMTSRPCVIYEGRDETLVVEASDVGRRWVVHIGERLTVDPEAGTLRDDHLTISGTATNLYLALWNRGGDVATTEERTVLERWARTQQVRMT